MIFSLFKLRWSNLALLAPFSYFAGKKVSTFRIGLPLGLLCLMQQPAASQILVGPVAGAQLGWIQFEDADTRALYRSQPKIGFQGGASVQIKMQKRFFLESSLLYVRRGKNLKSNLDGLFQNKATYHYIDLPILFTKEFRVRFGKSRFYNWYIGAGPNVSYWLGGKGVLNASDLEENLINPPAYNLPYTVTFEDSPAEIPLGNMNVSNPNRIQLGLNFSWGVVFEPNKFNKMMFTTRYLLGHSFYSPDEDGKFWLDGLLFYDDDMQVRNHMLSMSLFYFFDLKLDARNKGKSTSDLTNKRKR